MTTAVTADPRIGTEIAGYRIESLLGRGGMGVVYLAKDPWLERMVALKLIAPEVSENPRFRARFLRESKLAASLEHAHVVPIYEAGDAEGLLYLAMRYIDGDDLNGDARGEESARSGDDALVDRAGRHRARCGTCERTRPP